MVRTIIKLALVALIVHAAVKTVPAFWTYVKFRDKVEETARFSSRRTERDVQAEVQRIASRFDIPLTLDDIQVRKVKDHTFVDTNYTADLEYFPGRIYTWEFSVKVEGVPPRYSDVLP